MWFHLKGSSETCPPHSASEKSSSSWVFLLFEHKSKVTVHCIAMSPHTKFILEWEQNTRMTYEPRDILSILAQRYVNTSFQNKGWKCICFLPSPGELPPWNCYYMENNQEGLAPWNKRSNMINSSDKQQDPRESQLLTRHFQTPLF